MSLTDRSAWYQAAVAEHGRRLAGEQAGVRYAGDPPMPLGADPETKVRVRAAFAALVERGELPERVYCTLVEGSTVLFTTRGGRVVGFDTARRPVYEGPTINGDAGPGLF